MMMKHTTMALAMTIPITPVQMGGQTMQAVDARRLHQWLEVNEKFADWIKRRITEYGFVDNQDFISFSEISEKPQGGHPSTNYLISLDMAKELAMVERTRRVKI